MFGRNLWRVGNEWKPFLTNLHPLKLILVTRKSRKIFLTSAKKIAEAEI